MIEVRAVALNEALGRVVHAAATEEARPILCAVLFEGDEEGFRLVAADNYRIVVATLDREDHADFGRWVLALQGVPTLRAFLKMAKGNVAIEGKDTRLTFVGPVGSVSLRTIDGKYPNYAAILPASAPSYGVNPRYLAESAAATKGLVVKMQKDTGVQAPFLIEAPDYREAIMPVRIEEALS